MAAITVADLALLEDLRACALFIIDHGGTDSTLPTESPRTSYSGSSMLRCRETIHAKSPGAGKLLTIPVDEQDTFNDLLARAYIFGEYDAVKSLLRDQGLTDLDH